MATGIIKKMYNAYQKYGTVQAAKAILPKNKRKSNQLPNKNSNYRMIGWNGSFFRESNWINMRTRKLLDHHVHYLWRKMFLIFFGLTLSNWMLIKPKRHAVCVMVRLPIKPQNLWLQFCKDAGSCWSMYILGCCGF